MAYNERYYIDGDLWQLRPRRIAIKTYVTEDGIVIGMFQGSRGQYPDIDFIVRILKPGETERPFPPLHAFWVVDLMMKIIDFRKQVVEILEYYISFYTGLLPFSTPQERENYQFRTVTYILENYKEIEQPHTLSLEYVAIMIELFCINEKRNNGAYMFINLLKTLLRYAKNETDYITVVQASQPGFR